MNKQQKQIEFKIQGKFKVKALFEASIDTCGNNYLVIYGRHANGYYCAIPNWNASCEMAEPSDVLYNRGKLSAVIGMNAADALAHAIKEIAADDELNNFFAMYEIPGDNQSIETIFAKDIHAAYEEAKKYEYDGHKLIKIYTELEYLESLGFAVKTEA